ncbi:hypothetical protein ECPA31_3370, partial [Escherichia coli PA31]
MFLFGPNMPPCCLIIFILTSSN